MTFRIAGATTLACLSVVLCLSLRSRGCSWAPALVLLAVLLVSVAVVSGAFGRRRQQQRSLNAEMARHFCGQAAVTNGQPQVAGELRPAVADASGSRAVKLSTMGDR